MKKIDCVLEILKYCYKRQEILLGHGSISKYNRYLDKIIKYKYLLMEENRQDELLPYLKSDSISIRSDIAGILFESYPEQCISVMQEIAAMTTETGLPKSLVMLSVAAEVNLKYGVPKDYYSSSDE